MVSIANSPQRHARLWRYVVALFVLAASPTPAMAQDIQWIRQFGSVSSDATRGVAVDTSGVYVAGYADSALPGQTHSGGRDAFARKYNANGAEQWTSQFGTTRNDQALGVALDATGVYIVGYTGGILAGQSIAGEFDAFVRKYYFTGNEQWTRQFGGAGNTFAYGVAVDVTGIYVVGITSAALPGQTRGGGNDAFVRKYDPNGNVLWTRQFGGFQNESAYGVAADATGVYVVGHSADILFVRKYDVNGNELWQRQESSVIAGLGAATYGTGVYVLGFTDIFSPGQTLPISRDAFVRKYDVNGNGLWTRQFGPVSFAFSEYYGIATDASGVYVAGVVEGSLPTYSLFSLAADAFVRKYDANGNELWTRQFGTARFDGASGVSVDQAGIYVGGITNGALPDQTSAGASDAFVVKLAASTPPAPNPAVTEGAVWNNASYNVASLSVAPGMIAAVFGTNLTDGSTCVPPCYPALVDGKLGTTMAGAQVTINGVPVPLLYATSIQLGIQIPAELTGTSATIQATVGGQTSVSVTIPVEPFSPGIFTGNQQGTGAGAIHHLDAAGTRVSSQAPARAGEEVDIYCTGLGLVSPPIATGAIPSGNVTVATPTVTVDGVSATVVFSGLSGCCAGIYQVRIRIPSAARSGNDIAVVLSIGGKQANPVTIAVVP